MDGETVYPASIPFVHAPMLDLSEPPRKPSDGNLAALKLFCGSVTERFAST